MTVLPELKRHGGPTSAVAARNGVGFTSSEAFPIELSQGSGTRLFEIPADIDDRVVETGEQLQWVIFPEGAGPVPALWDSTAAAIDLEFTDGTRLSELAATDQYGAGIRPAAQAAAKTMWVDQWNRRTVNLQRGARQARGTGPGSRRGLRTHRHPRLLRLHRHPGNRRRTRHGRWTRC